MTLTPRWQAWHVVLFIGLLTPTLSVFGGLALAAALPIITVFGVLPLLLADQRWKSIFQASYTRLFLGLAAWMAITMLWSYNVPDGYYVWWRIGGLFLCGSTCITAFYLLGTMPPNFQKFAKWLAGGLLIALGFALLEALTGGFFVKFYFLHILGRPDYFLHDLNRGACYVALFVWPVALLVFLAGYRWQGISLILLTWLCVLPLDSLSAVVALVIGSFIALAVYFGKRPVLRALMGIAVLDVIATPIFFSLASAKRLQELLDFMPFTALHRLYIWEFAAHKALEHPFFGWGLNTSRTMPGGTDEIWPGKALLPLHPHNNILQIWLETGIPGLILMAAIMCFVLWKIERAPVSWLAKALATGLIFTYLSIGMLAFGVWQHWWVASGFLAASVMVYALRLARESQPAGKTF